MTGIPLNDMHKAYGQLEELPEGYRVNHARIDMIDEQNVEKCLLFPTLGDCVEGLMHDNVPMAYKVFHAFNLWLEEDWGYAYKDRLYAPPYIPMLDPDLAADELEFLLNKGVKAVSIRPGPANGRSPADPSWDRFWSLMNESGTLARVPRLRRHDEVQRGVRPDVGPVAHRPRLQRLAVGRVQLRPRHPRARPSRSCSATCSAASRT